VPDEQQGLFGPLREDSVPFQRHSPTSAEAAKMMSGPLAAKLRRQVYQFVTVQGDYGATDEEIQDHLCMNPSTERPRRVELVQEGLVVDSGGVRFTKARRRAVVWWNTDPVVRARAEKQKAERKKEASNA
jgi:hypothetical protein